MPLDSVSINFNGYALYSPRQLATECARLGFSTSSFANKANSFVNPRGTQSGKSYILMLWEDLKLIDFNKSTHYLEFQWNNTTIRVANLTIVCAVSPIPSGVVEDQNIYLVELADKRHYGNLASVNSSYNILQSDDSTYYADTKNGSSAWTWQEMFSDIWSFLPERAKGTATPTLPAASIPSDDPSNYSFVGVTVWEAVDKILSDLSCELRLQIDGEYEVVSSGTLDLQNEQRKTTATQTESRLIDHEQPQGGTIARVPEKLAIHFPWRNVDYLQAYVVIVNTSTIDSTLSTEAGTILPVWDNLEALSDGTSTPTNASALSTRATEVATGIVLGDHSRKRRMEVFSGLLDLRSGPDYERVSFYDLGQRLKTSVVNPCQQIRRYNPDGQFRLRTALVWTGVNSGTATAVSGATTVKLDTVIDSLGGVWGTLASDVLPINDTGWFIFDASGIVANMTEDANIVVWFEEDTGSGFVTIGRKRVFQAGDPHPSSGGVGVDYHIYWPHRITVSGSEYRVRAQPVTGTADIYGDSSAPDGGSTLTVVKIGI